MLRSLKTIDADGVRERLNELQAAVRREADSAEADPFDEADDRGRARGGRGVEGGG